MVLDKVGSVLERYNYYPYGEIVPVSVASSGNTDYLYTGKESQNALFGINWYDSGARFQTTDGIFTSIDPLEGIVAKMKQLMHDIYGKDIE